MYFHIFEVCLITLVYRLVFGLLLIKITECFIIDSIIPAETIPAELLVCQLWMNCLLLFYFDQKFC